MEGDKMVQGRIVLDILTKRVQLFSNLNNLLIGIRNIMANIVSGNNSKNHPLITQLPNPNHLLTNQRIF